MLNPQHWQGISPYLDHALALPEQERAGWLAQFRERNPELGALVEALLCEHRVLEDEEFLERGQFLLLEPLGLSGQTIGPYTLISEIGHGGMGTVWRAERSDGLFKRQVAIKFLHVAFVGRDGEERFKREGRILGYLAHPHIAELIDAGVSASSQPYLVLEYVDGDHIDRYCDRRKLDVEGRVRLFLDVLSAVAHAHSNLIVHRDIKPSNVLVRNDGQVKLLDFGIAKLLGDDLEGGAGLVTMDSGRPMTPEYAAPEQLKGGTVTTGTDIYALGVLLYVLLTGKHPAGTGPHSPAELIRAIVDTEPPRASDALALTRSNEVITAHLSKCGVTPDRLQRLLRGDLDTIIAKALKKEADERYASVDAFADDLRRYLNSEPIRARPEAMAYRTAKFIRRNRPAVTLAFLAVTATVVGLVGTFLQARTAHAQRDFALRQLLRAEAVNEFNEFLLSDAAPSGKPFTVEDLLGRAERVLAKQHAPDDNDRVELLVSIGDQYSTQDEDAKARRVLEQAYSISRTLPTKSVRAQASCALAGALARDGDLIRAETLFRDGLREVSAEPQYALDRIFCLRRGSEVAQQRGDSREGIARIEQAHTILRASPFDSDVPELHVLIELAEAYRMAGRNQQAVPAFEAAAKLLSSLGRDNTQTEVALLNGWALALDRVGRPREAEKLFLRAIGISRAGGKDDFVSPLLLNNYAKTLLQLSRLNDAACYAERAYAKAWHVDNQLAISQSLYVRALIYLDQPDVTRAAAMLAELEPRLRRSLPADSYWFGALASAQSMLAQDRGDLQTASELAGRALAITEASVKAGGQGMDFLPALLLRQAVISLKIGRHDEATALASRALKLLQAETRAGTFSAWIGRAYLTLGRALQLEGKEEDARAAFQAAAEHLQNTLGPDHPDTRSARRLCVRLRSTEKA